MNNAVCGECVDFALDWEVLLDPGLWFVEVQFRIKRFEPSVCFLLVGCSSIFWDSVLDDSEAIFKKIRTPVDIFGSGKVSE